MRAQQPLSGSVWPARAVFAVLAVAFAAAVARPLLRPYVYSDFATFYGAARCFVEGRDAYDPQALKLESGFAGWVGRYFYPPPFAACFVRPLTRLPLAVARRIWVLVEAAAYLAAALLLGAAWGRNRLERGVVLAAFLPYAPMALDLKLGSVSGLLLLLVVVFLVHYEAGHATRAALALAAAVLLKLSPLLLVVYLLARRDFRFVARCAACGLLLVAACLPWTGFDAYVQYFTRVVPELATAGFSWFTNQSVDAYWGRILLSNPDTTPWMHAPWLHRLVTWGTNAALGMALLRLAPRAGHRGRSPRLEFAAVLLVALVVPRVSWEYMFVLALPAFAHWGLHAARCTAPRRRIAGVAIAYLLCALPFPYAELPPQGAALLLQGPRLVGTLWLFALTWWEMQQQEARS